MSVPLVGDAAAAGILTRQRMPPAPSSIPPRALALLAVLTLVWGTNWPLFPLAVREVSVWTFRAVSVSIAGVALLAVALALLVAVVQLVAEEILQQYLQAKVIMVGQAVSPHLTTVLAVVVVLVWLVRTEQVPFLGMVVMGFLQLFLVNL
jgi:hypothetical protein